MWGDASPDATIDRLHAFGIGEVVVKNGGNEAVVDHKGERQRIAGPQHVRVVDTTAAGDSFNAAYLAARLKGSSPADAVAAAHLLASEVVQHRGAIIPRTQHAMH